VSGQRPSRKIRAIAARFPELGEIRYVEGNPPSPRAWAISAIFVVGCSVGVVLGNGGVVDGLWILGVWTVLGGLILWYLGSEKLVVLERGLLIGSVAPFLTPAVVPFHRFDASSVVAVRPVYKLGAMVARQVPLRQGRNTVWGHNGVAFVGAGVRATRPVVDASAIFRPVGTSSMEDQLLPGVWWFGTWHRTDALVHALEAAMVVAGAPGAAGMAQAALPQVKLSGRPEDADAQVPRMLRSGGVEGPVVLSAEAEADAEVETSGRADGREPRIVTRMARWAFGIASVLFVVFVAAAVADVMVVSVGALVVMVAVGGAGVYEVLDRLLTRMQRRRRDQQAQRERMH
jgi:hypothetical protein